MVDQKTNSKLYHSLIADIGGTNARLQYISFTSSSSKYNVLKSQNYLTNNFPSLTELLAHFLEEYLRTDIHPDYTVISIAGPVVDNTVEMANTNWPKIDGNAVGQHFNIKDLQLINDFVAIGYSLLKIPEDDIVKLNDAVKIPGEHIGVVGPGTGLGQCFLFSTPGENGTFEYHVKGTEGGHANMAVRNE